MTPETCRKYGETLGVLEFYERRHGAPMNDSFFDYLKNLVGEAECWDALMDGYFAGLESDAVRDCRWMQARDENAAYWQAWRKRMADNSGVAAWWREQMKLVDVETDYVEITGREAGRGW